MPTRTTSRTLALAVALLATCSCTKVETWDVEIYWSTTGTGSDRHVLAVVQVCDGEVDRMSVVDDLTEDADGTYLQISRDGQLLSAPLPEAYDRFVTEAAKPGAYELRVFTGDGGLIASSTNRIVALPDYPMLVGPSDSPVPADQLDCSGR